MPKSINIQNILTNSRSLLMKIILVKIVWIIILLFFPINKSLAADCYIVKDAMAFNQPNVTVRACDLYFQSNKEGKDSFVQLILEKKVIYLKKGTRVFDCGVDLENMRDVDEARIRGVILPTFHCYGKIITLAPIRPSGHGSCFWIDWDGVE